jgi:pimeloyl-ACP methyl ester carboxylesterase
MEQAFVINASDNAEIHGFIHPSSNKSRPIVVLVHGLTGHMDEYIHLRLARLLSKEGFSVIRFNQYGDEPRARRFHDSTIRKHVSDTKDVLTYAIKEGYSTIVLAGHSLGSPVAIAATGDLVSGLILIDPTGRPMDRIRDWQTYDAEHGISYLDWSRRIILGERWIEGAISFPDSYLQFANVTCPVQIIAAERADQMKYCECYRQAHPEHPVIQVVPNATHCFPEEGATEALGSMISKWIASNINGDRS